MTAALLTAAVAPKVRWSEVDGEAAATMLPGSPAVGDCAISIAEPLPVLSAVRGVDDLVGYPTVTLGTCDGAIVGEVGTVIAGASPPAIVSLPDYQADVEACTEGIVGYTGSMLTVVDNPSFTTAMVWDPGLTFRQIPFGPTAVQRLVGQHWSACLVTASAGQSYHGRLAGALSTGIVPGSLGSCWSSEELATADQVSCAVPHPIEVLGTSVLGRPTVSIVDIRRSCLIFAGRVLRSPDPTEGGAVRITATISRTAVACVATDARGRMFNGTLIGLQGHGVPTH